MLPTTNPLVQAFPIPAHSARSGQALRKNREGQGTHRVVDVGEMIKAWATRPICPCEILGPVRNDKAQKAGSSPGFMPGSE
jgi:hypothetical protein